MKVNIMKVLGIFLKQIFCLHDNQIPAYYFSVFLFCGILLKDNLAVCKKEVPLFLHTQREKWQRRKIKMYTRVQVLYSS